MFSVRTFLSAVVAVTAIAGCDSPADKQAAAERAQREADRKAAKISNDVENRVTDVEKRVTDVERSAAEEVSRIKQNAIENINDVNAVAREKSAEADDALAKARAGARARAVKKLERLEKEIGDIRLQLESKQPKSDADRLMKDMQGRSEAVWRSLRDLDDVTAQNLDAVKANITQRVDELEGAIENAKKRTW